MGGESRLGSFYYPLGTWVGEVSMDSEEMIGFLLKPAKLYDGRAGNDLRKLSGQTSLYYIGRAWGLEK